MVLSVFVGGPAWSPLLHGRAPFGLAVVTIPLGNYFLVRAVGVTDHDLVVVPTPAGPGEPLAVGRPGGLVGGRGEPSRPVYRGHSCHRATMPVGPRCLCHLRGGVCCCRRRPLRTPGTCRPRASTGMLSGCRRATRRGRRCPPSRPPSTARR